MTLVSHVLVLDEGTTSTRAVLFDQDGTVVDEQQEGLSVSTSETSIVEQDATEIADKSVAVLRAVVARAAAARREIAALGITNQRTTTMLWDRNTGEPVAPVVSWQDTRAAGAVEQLSADWSRAFTQRVGLVLAAACVPLHLAALLEDPELRRRAEAGELLAGTPDSWVLWKLTGGPNGGRHLTSYSNGSSTGAMDLAEATWWEPWLDALGVPVSLFPRICADDADYGVTDGALIGAELPIRADLADQHAALFGHGGFTAGSVKCTHGTGSFVNFNIGRNLVVAGNGLDTRCAWHAGGGTRYLIEGNSFTTGSTIDWLVKGIGVLSDARELDATCARTPDSSGLVCVPALAGFTSPHWDPRSRGLLIGLHRGTTQDHIVRAAVDGIAHTVADLVLDMAEQSGVMPTMVSADGGLARSEALLQAQADFTGVPVEQAADAEYVTARGAAWMAGTAVGVWQSPEDAAQSKDKGRVFVPELSERARNAQREAWRTATDRAIGWRPADSVTFEEHV